MASEKKIEQQQEDQQEVEIEWQHQYSIDRIKEMLENPSEPFDFKQTLDIMKKKRIEEFEKQSLFNAQSLIHQALWKLSSTDDVRKFESLISMSVHPITKQTNIDWIKQYIIDHAGEYVDVTISDKDMFGYTKTY